MTQKTPFEIRLELLQEARLILQAQAGEDSGSMPTTEQVIAEARKLNDFVSNSR